MQGTQQKGAALSHDSHTGPPARQLFAVGGLTILAADIDEALQAAPELAFPAAGSDCKEVDAALTAFRYRRRLISAEDLQRWLDAHDLSLGELRAALPGAVAHTLRERVIRLLVDEAWPRRVHQTAVRLAAWYAAGNALGRPLPWSCIEAHYQHWLTSGRDSSARTRHLQQDSRRWSRLVYEWLEFDTQEACDEAWCCASADGEDLAEIARRERLPHAIRSDLLIELPGWLADRLGGLGPGECAAPVIDWQPCLLVQLREWHPATLTDPVTRRAIDLLIDEEMGEAIASEHVRWLDA